MYSHSCATIVIVAKKMRYLRFFKSEKVVGFCLWFLFVMYAMNTIGNLFATNPIEKYGFSIVTLVMYMLVLRLVTEGKKML